MRNIELKARLRDPSRAVRICEEIGAAYQGDIRQTDTYFRVLEGRLKLRECEPGEDYLVFYRRPDMAHAKGSDYFIEPASPSMGTFLTTALGRLAVVRKVRALWLWENVRIHLDHVDELGAFIEFEAVLSTVHDDADGHAKIARLRTAFAIEEADLLPGSYVEMVLTPPPA